MCNVCCKIQSMGIWIETVLQDFKSKQITSELFNTTLQVIQLQNYLYNKEVQSAINLKHINFKVVSPSMQKRRVFNYELE